MQTIGTYDETIDQRLHGIARHWHRRFLLHHPSCNRADLYQQAWLYWLERPKLEKEKRFEQIHSAVRRYAIREVCGYVPHQSKAGVPLRFCSADRLTTVVPFDAHIELGKIVSACLSDKRRRGKGRLDHIRTIAMIAGTWNSPTKKKLLKDRLYRLRRFLASHGFSGES